MQRRFILGDQWLYYKIYAGPKTCDSILSDIIKPVTEKLIKAKIIDQWFFIRYADPKHHLRIRLHYNTSEHIGTIINTIQPLLKAYVDADLIWRIQTDTYQREVERYGEKTMDISERIFYYDSQMMVNVLSMIEGDQGEEVRWLFSLKAIDVFLDSFNYNDHQKLKLLTTLQTGYRAEFDTSKVLGKQLNDKYRIERETIALFMDLNTNSHPDYVPLVHLLIERQNKMKHDVATLLALENNGALEVDFNRLLESYIHMSMNRIFKSQNRMHEMVCYDFLCRYYRTQLALKSKNHHKE